MYSIAPHLTARETAPILPRAGLVCAWVLRIAVCVALILGVSNLFFWIIGSVPTFSFWPGMMVMRVNTATAITAAALSLVLWSGNPSAGRRRAAQLLGLIVVLVGGLTALQDIAGFDLGIDRLLGPGTIPGDLAHNYVRHPGRMSLNAALSLFLLGLALVGLDASIPLGDRRIWFAPGLALLGSMPASLGLVGYLLGVVRFTGLLRSTNILLHTATALLALAIGIFVARPERPPLRRILSTGADGVLLRWTLPGTALLLLSLRWLIGYGRSHGIVGYGESSALMVYSGLILLFILLIVASRAVSRQEARALAAADALRAGQERNRAIIDTALDAVLLMDDEGMIVDWNPAAERIFGWQRAEVIGQPLAERIIPPELRSAHYRGMAHLKKTGEGPVLTGRLELPALHRDGTRFSIELSVSALPGSERPLFVGFIRDITERQAADGKLRSAKETAEAASRAKDNFVAALSHELRTPLAPVLLSAAVLRDDDRLPDDVREQMAMMERNIALEARLIDDLLDLTRITRGKLPLRSEPVEVHSLISYAVDIVREEAAAKSVDLAVKLRAERSGLTGDPARLQQVFWNLLKNAVKFTPAAGRITIATRNDPTGERLIIEVTDTGAGFSPEAAEKIFQPFEQAGREGDHRLGGLGLGLAIARAIVDLHGGSIRAHSRGNGQGATFTVDLAGATNAPSGIVSSDPNESVDLSPAPSQRILLVEDHEPTLNILTRLLRRAGHEVHPAASVTAACETARDLSFTVLISDLGLPDGTGVELIRALRPTHPDFRAIALSGYGMEDDLQRTRDAGFDDHLVKPVDFDQLRRALRKITAVD